MYSAQPPMLPPWAMTTPCAPPSGTSISAVTACDLFLIDTIACSESRVMPPNSRWRSPLTSTGRPAISGISRSATRSSSGSTLFFVASITNSRWRWWSRSGSWAARSSACVQSALVS